MAPGTRDVRAHVEDLIALEEAALARLQTTPEEIAMFEAGAALAGPRAVRAFVAWHRCKVLRELRTLIAVAAADTTVPRAYLPPPVPPRRDPHTEPDQTEPRGLILEFEAEEPSGC